MKFKAPLILLVILIFLSTACLSPTISERFQSLVPGESPTPTATETDIPTITTTSTQTPTLTPTPTIAPSPTPVLPDITGSVTSVQDRAGNRSFVLCKLEGTNCILTSLTTISDKTGYFEFYDVPAGQYYIFYDSGHEDFSAGVKKWEGKTIQMGNVQWLADNFATKNEKGEISFTLVPGMTFDNNTVYMAIYRFFAFSPFLWAHSCNTKNCATPEDVQPIIADSGSGIPSNVKFEVYGPFEEQPVTEETPVVTNNSTPVGETIYQDNFSDPASGWNVSKDKISERLYQNGEYILKVGPGVSTSGVSDYSEMYEDWAYLCWSPAGLSDLKNVVIDVDARSIGETLDGSYGIIFYFRDRNHYYFYQIYPGDGQWALVERKSSGANDVVGWTKSSAILSGDEVNHLRLELGEDTVSFYVNGELIDTRSISNQEGDVGVYTDTWNSEKLIFEAAFDNFTVSVLP